MFRLRYSLFVVSRRCIQKCPICAFFSFFFVKLKTLFFFRCIKLVLSLAHLLVFLSAERRSPKSNESQTIDSRGPVKLMRALKRGQNPAYGNIFEVYLKTWDVIFVNRHDVIAKLEDVFLTIVEDLSKDKPPSLKYNSRTSWKNTR